MTTQLEKKHYTVEEYLAQELPSETRSGYRNGVIIPMTGGTPNHNDIAGNLYMLLKLALKGKNYRMSRETYSRQAKNEQNRNDTGQSKPNCC